MLHKLIKINLKIIGFIVLLLILIQCITAYIFGYIAKNQLELQFQHMTDSPYIKVVSHEYNRGLFSSNEVSEIAINSVATANLLKILPKQDKESQEANQIYSIKLNTHIEHGIFSSLMHGYFIPSIAYTNTTVVFPSDIKKILDKFFSNKPPLIVTNIIYLNKSGKIHITSSEFNYEEAVSGIKVIWGGLNLNINYNSDFNSFANKMKLPLLKLNAAEKGHLELYNLDYQSNTRLSKNKIKVGDTNLNLASIDAKWQDKVSINFKLGDVLNMLTGISSTEFLNGIDAIDPNGFTISNVKYSSKSQDENNFFGANSNIQFSSLITNGQTYGPMNIDMEINHISSPEFSKLVDRMADLSLIPVSNDNYNSKLRQQLIETLNAYFGPILVANPVINLKDFQLNTPNGLIKLSGLATTNNFTLNDMETQQKFLKKLIIDFNFSMPKSTIAYLFVLQMKYLLSAGNAQMDKQSAEALTRVVNILLDNQVNTWVKKGYIKLENSTLKSHLKFKDGQLWLNDVKSKQ